ncbi:MAG: integrase core domain-containing protein [Deltaproteobacteria bacterium]|nr:integrase core domain-containing protein [Deltaproteobacteria bacterium]
MIRRGNCWDNAVAESFFATLKKELIHLSGWLTLAAARKANSEYIEFFYDRPRSHSPLGYLSPVEYERRNLASKETRTS